MAARGNFNCVCKQRCPINILIASMWHGSIQHNDIVNAQSVDRLMAFREVMYEAARNKDAKDYREHLTDSFIMPEASPETKSWQLSRVQNLKNL